MVFLWPPNQLLWTFVPDRPSCEWPKFVCTWNILIGKFPHHHWLALFLTIMDWHSPEIIITVCWTYLKQSINQSMDWQFMHHHWLANFHTIIVYVTYYNSACNFSPPLLCGLSRSGVLWIQKLKAPLVGGPRAIKGSLFLSRTKASITVKSSQ